jgi:hypothetical protein
MVTTLDEADRKARLERARETGLFRYSLVQELVNNRIRTRESVETDVRALSNAIVTHWDPIPPPPTAEVTRVPRMIQRISAIRPLPARRTRAWLTDKQFSRGRWTATMAISIGEADNAPGGVDSRDAAVPGNRLEAASQLIVLPHAVRAATRASPAVAATTAARGRM